MVKGTVRLVKAETLLVEVVPFAVSRALLPDKRRPRVAVLLSSFANYTTSTKRNLTKGAFTLKFYAFYDFVPSELARWNA